MKKSKANNEVDLVELFLHIFNHKVKIGLIILLTIAVAFGIKTVEKNEEFTNTKLATKFGPISIYDHNYNYKNIFLDIDYELKTLSRKTLFDLFTKILEGGLSQMIKDFDFIKLEDYQNREAYEDAIEKIISSIEIIKPGEEKKNKEGVNIGKESTGMILFSSTNDDLLNNWINFVDTLENSTNKKTQAYLQDVISARIKRANLKKKIDLEDLENEIEKAIEIYKLKKNSQLSFLKEQAKIAREANIESESIKPSNFGYNYSMTYNEDVLSLYYLKGYRVIEKEIELINKRKNPYLFAEGIVTLRSKKNQIRRDQTLVREEALFKETPIFNEEKKFLAGRIGPTSTKIETFNRATSMSTTLMAASLFGFIFAMFYIAISKKIHDASKRKNN